MAGRLNFRRQFPYQGKGRNRTRARHHQADRPDARWAHLGRVDAREKCNLPDAALAEEDDMTKNDQLFRIMAALDRHFAADDCLPAH